MRGRGRRLQQRPDTLRNDMNNVAADDSCTVTGGGTALNDKRCGSLPVKRHRAARFFWHQRLAGAAPAQAAELLEPI